jgi:hypothetical protein
VLAALSIMKRLEQILNRVKSEKLEEGLLYLPSDGEWTLESPCLIINEGNLSDGEKNKFGYPLITLESGLHATFVTWFIHEIADKAIELEDPLSNETLLEAIVYYYEHEEFLPEVGAAPPEEEIVDEDLVFYDSLGSERESVKCKNVNCSRGAIINSVFCRTHHFEMLFKRACKFTHQ